MKTEIDLNRLSENNPIEKSTLERVIELFNALLLLRDCIGHLNEGKEYHLKTLYGQLRAILTDKTQKSRYDSPPLLIDLAEKMNIDLSFYANALFIKKHKIFEELRSSTILQYTELELSLDKLRTFHEKTNLIEFLDIEVLIERGIGHNFRYIINTLSDKYGGSHYDPTTDEKILGLKSIELNGRPLVDQYLLELSKIVVSLGIKIPKQVSDLCVQFGFKLSNEASKVMYLFDFMHKRFRISLKTIEKKIIIDLSDLNGCQLTLEKDEVLESNKLYLITINHVLQTDYNSIVTVYLNENQLFTQKTNSLLLFNNAADWEFILNSSVDKTKQDFGFEIGYIYISSNVLNKDQHTSVWAMIKNIKLMKINRFELIDDLKKL